MDSRALDAANEHLRVMRRTVQTCLREHEHNCQCGNVAEETVEVLDRLLTEFLLDDDRQSEAANEDRE